MIIEATDADGLHIILIENGQYVSVRVDANVPDDKAPTYLKAMRRQMAAVKHDDVLSKDG